MKSEPPSNKRCIPCEEKKKIKTIADAAAAADSLKKVSRVGSLVGQFGVAGLLHLLVVHFELLHSQTQLPEHLKTARLLETFEATMGRHLEREFGMDQWTQMVAKTTQAMLKLGIIYIPAKKEKKATPEN